MLRIAGEMKQLKIIASEGPEPRDAVYKSAPPAQSCCCCCHRRESRDQAHGLSPSLARGPGEEQRGRVGSNPGLLLHPPGQTRGPLTSVSSPSTRTSRVVRSSPAHPRAARARPAPGPAEDDECRGPASWARAGVGSCGEAGRLRGQSSGCAAGRGLLFSTHTCCCGRAAMSRVVSLLLGAALLCGHGVFCRRVVSGESGGCPPSGRARRGHRGVRGRGRCGAACSGVKALPEVGNLCGVGGREEPGAWRGRGIDGGLLSSLPPKNKRREKFKFFGSAWFSSCEASSVTAFSKSNFHFLCKSWPQGRAWHLQKGWGTMEWAEEAQSHKNRRNATPCWPGLTSVPALCSLGWFPRLDLLAVARSQSPGHVCSLCSQGVLTKEEGTYWSLCVDTFPLHTLFQVGDFSEKEDRSSWAGVYMVMKTGSCTQQVPNQVGRVSAREMDRNWQASKHSL